MYYLFFLELRHKLTLNKTVVLIGKKISILMTKIAINKSAGDNVTTLLANSLAVMYAYQSR